MNAGAILIVLMLGAAAAAPLAAHAQDVAADTDPACAAYQPTLTAAAKSSDPAAYAQAAAAIPAACPNLKAMADAVIANTRASEQMGQSANQAYHAEAPGSFDNALRSGDFRETTGRPTATGGAGASQGPPTEPPGSYDAPPASGGNPPPAQ